MTQRNVVLLIMDMESAKSDENGPKKKYVLDVFYLKRDKNTKEKIQKHIDPNCIELNVSFIKIIYGFAALCPVSI